MFSCSVSNIEGTNNNDQSFNMTIDDNMVIKEHNVLGPS